MKANKESTKISWTSLIVVIMRIYYVILLYMPEILIFPPDFFTFFNCTKRISNMISAGRIRVLVFSSPEQKAPR